MHTVQARLRWKTPRPTHASAQMKTTGMDSHSGTGSASCRLRIPMNLTTLVVTILVSRADLVATLAGRAGYWSGTGVEGRDFHCDCKVWDSNRREEWRRLIYSTTAKPCREVTNVLSESRRVLLRPAYSTVRKFQSSHTASCQPSYLVCLPRGQDWLRESLIRLDGTWWGDSYGTTRTNTYSGPCTWIHVSRQCTCSRYATLTHSKTPGAGS